MLPTSTDVLVVGAGPTGLATALTLARRGVEVTVLDRLAAPPMTSRAAVVHAYTLEVLDRIDAAAPLVAQGGADAAFHRARPGPGAAVGAVPRAAVPLPLRAAGLPVGHRGGAHRAVGRTRRPGTTAVPAHRAEPRPATACSRRSTDEALRRPVRRRRGRPAQHGPASWPASASPAGSDEESFVLADVRVRSVLPRDEAALFLARSGPLVWAPLPDGVVRLVAAVATAPAEPDAAYLQALLDERGPARRPDRVTEVLWGSRFRVHHRIADTFRAGPVLLAGDAGHVHSPAGGQGMNLGICDAVALGTALADVLDGGPETLLDDYTARQRPMAEDVLSFAAGLTRLATVSPARRPARDVLLAAARCRATVRAAGSRCACPGCPTGNARRARRSGLARRLRLGTRGRSAGRSVRHAAECDQRERAGRRTRHRHRAVRGGGQPGERRTERRGEQADHPLGRIRPGRAARLGTFRCPYDAHRLFHTTVPAAKTASANAARHRMPGQREPGQRHGLRGRAPRAAPAPCRAGRRADRPRAPPPRPRRSRRRRTARSRLAAPAARPARRAPAPP